jgi:hypothetical protein
MVYHLYVKSTVMLQLVVEFNILVWRRNSRLPRKLYLEELL